MKQIRKMMKSAGREAIRLSSIPRAALSRAKIGSGTKIHFGVRLIKRGGAIRLGCDCELHPGVMVMTYGGEIDIGDDCSVNPYSILYGHGGLKIGRGVRIASHVVIIPSNHQIEPDLPIHKQKIKSLGITVGDDVWIGTRVTILDGAKIADGCVLAAGAVVTGSLVTEPMGIYGGVPARKIGSRLEMRGPGSGADTELQQQE